MGPKNPRAISIEQESCQLLGGVSGEGQEAQEALIPGGIAGRPTSEMKLTDLHPREHTGFDEGSRCVSASHLVSGDSVGSLSQR